MRSEALQIGDPTSSTSFAMEILLSLIVMVTMLSVIIEHSLTLAPTLPLSGCLNYYICTFPFLLSSLQRLVRICVLVSGQMHSLVSFLSSVPLAFV